MSKSQFLTQHSDNGVTILTFTQSLLNADAMTEAFAVITGSESRNVILDCQSVRFLVSGSLYPDQEPFRSLLKLHKQLADEGGRLVLCNVASDFADVLRITRFDRILEIQPNVRAALDCMTRTGIE